MAFMEAAQEITDENLMRKHKMKLNGWWDIGIKELYDNYKQAKSKYKNDKTTLNKILAKRAKKAFRMKQDENKKGAEVKT